MIPRQGLRHKGLYLGVHNRLGGYGEDELWTQATMMWHERDGCFYQPPLGPWPPSPFEYFDKDNRFATFVPIRDTGKDYTKED